MHLVGVVVVVGPVERARGSGNNNNWSNFAKQKARYKVKPKRGASQNLRVSFKLATERRPFFYFNQPGAGRASPLVQ